MYITDPLNIDFYSSHGSVRGRGMQWEGRTSWLRGTLIDLVWVQIVLAVIVNKHLVMIQWLLLNERMVSVPSSVKSCPCTSSPQHCGCSHQLRANVPGLGELGSEAGPHRWPLRVRVSPWLRQSCELALLSSTWWRPSWWHHSSELVLHASPPCWLPCWYGSVMESGRENLTGRRSIRRGKEAKKNPVVSWTN